MKKGRHEKIIELIRNNEIETQEEIVKLLNDSGFNVTQATISRDISKLKLTKVPKANGGQKYAIIDVNGTFDEKYIKVLKTSFKSMDIAGNILVIKTLVGMANAAAAAIDTMKFEEIVGTIAGDDTIMCATKSADTVLVLKNKFELLIK